MQYDVRKPCASSLQLPETELCTGVRKPVRGGGVLVSSSDDQPPRTSSMEMSAMHAVASVDIVHADVRKPRASSAQLLESMDRANNREWQFLTQSLSECAAHPRWPPISMLWRATYWLPGGLLSSTRRCLRGRGLPWRTSIYLQH